MRKVKSIRITTPGTVIKAPERVKADTGKVMAVMTIFCCSFIVCYVNFNSILTSVLFVPT